MTARMITFQVEAMSYAPQIEQQHKHVAEEQLLSLYVYEQEGISSELQTQLALIEL